MQYYGSVGEPCQPQNILWTEEPWRGRRLFTGPDEIGDHRVTVEPEHRYVGIGTMSREGTSEADYLWRACPTTAHPRPKTSHVGEVGWGIPDRTDWSVANSSRQIMLGHFRQDCEDRHSHLYQNPWYPGPNEEIDPCSDAALVMNVYRPRRSRSAGRPYRPEPPDEGDGTSQTDSDSRPGHRTRSYLDMGK